MCGILTIILLLVYLFTHPIQVQNVYFKAIFWSILVGFIFWCIGNEYFKDKKVDNIYFR